MSSWRKLFSWEVMPDIPVPMVSTVWQFKRTRRLEQINLSVNETSNMKFMVAEILPDDTEWVEEGLGVGSIIFEEEYSGARISVPLQHWQDYIRTK